MGVAGCRANGCGDEGLKGFPSDPSMQIMPTVGPEVCKYYLHWAIWIPRGWVLDFGLCRLGFGV